MTDIVERISTSPGYFVIKDYNNSKKPEDIAKIANRVVTNDCGKYGTPYQLSDNNFWYIDSMNNWHITIIRKNYELHCLIQCRQYLFGDNDKYSEVIKAYALVIKNQCRYVI